MTKQKYQFRVEGDLPPKKDGASSMWGKASEFQRLVKLRQAAHEVFGERPPLQRNIKLSVIIYVGQTNSSATGDLDNFITGICDGLQAAHPNTPLDLWQDPSLKAIYPRRPIAILDDSQVVSINAEKRLGEDTGLWYEVMLEGEL